MSAKEKRMTGFMQCTKCGVIEHREREVICWTCGKGEMVWRPSPQRKKEEPRNG